MLPDVAAAMLPGAFEAHRIVDALVGSQHGTHGDVRAIAVFRRQAQQHIVADQGIVRIQGDDHRLRVHAHRADGGDHVGEQPAAAGIANHRRPLEPLHCAVEVFAARGIRCVVDDHRAPGWALLPAHGVETSAQTPRRHVAPADHEHERFRSLRGKPVRQCALPLRLPELDGRRDALFQAIQHREPLVLIGFALVRRMHVERVLVAASIGVSCAFCDGGVQGAMPGERQAVVQCLVRPRAGPEQAQAMEQAGAHFRSPRTPARVFRRVLAIPRLGDVAGDGDRFWIVAQDRDHLRQVVVRSVAPADHCVHIDLQDVGRRADLEAGQGGGDLRTRYAVRMRRGDAEPAAVDGRRGLPGFRAIENAVDPAGFAQTQGRLPQRLRVARDVRAGEAFLAAVQNEHTLGERPRRLELGDQMRHLHSQRVGVHRAGFDEQGDGASRVLASEWRQRTQLERDVVRRRLEAFPIDGGVFDSPHHGESGAGEGAAQRPFGAMHVRAQATPAHLLVQCESCLVASARRQDSLRLGGFAAEREQRIAAAHDHAAVFLHGAAQVREHVVELLVIFDRAKNAAAEHHVVGCRVQGLVQLHDEVQAASDSPPLRRRQRLPARPTGLVGVVGNHVEAAASQRVGLLAVAATVIQHAALAAVDQVQHETAVSLWLSGSPLAQGGPNGLKEQLETVQVRQRLIPQRSAHHRIEVVVRRKAPREPSALAHDPELLLPIRVVRAQTDVRAIVDQPHATLYDAQIVWIDVAADDAVAMALRHQAHQPRPIAAPVRFALLERIGEHRLMPGFLEPLERIDEARIRPLAHQRAQQGRRTDDLAPLPPEVEHLVDIRTIGKRHAFLAAAKQPQFRAWRHQPHRHHLGVGYSLGLEASRQLREVAQTSLMHFNGSRQLVQELAHLGRAERPHLALDPRQRGLGVSLFQGAAKRPQFLRAGLVALLLPPRLAAQQFGKYLGKAAYAIERQAKRGQPLFGVLANQPDELLDAFTVKAYAAALLRGKEDIRNVAEGGEEGVAANVVHHTVFVERLRRILAGTIVVQRQRQRHHLLVEMPPLQQRPDHVRPAGGPSADHRRGVGGQAQGFHVEHEGVAAAS